MNVVTATKGSNAVTIVDNVPRDSQGSREIGFSVPDGYNASDILFDNLDAGRGDRPAVIGAFEEKLLTRRSFSGAEGVAVR